MRRNDKRLGELLLEVGWIEREQLDQALSAQQALGGRIGSCLLEVDAITEEQLLRALSHQLGVRASRIKDLKNVPPEVHRLIPRELAIEHSAVPFRVLGNELSIALLDVHSRRRYEELAAAAGKGVCVFVGNEVRVFAALESYYGLALSERFRQLHARLDARAAERGLAGPKEPTYEKLVPPTPDATRESFAPESGSGPDVDDDSSDGSLGPAVAAGNGEEPTGSDERSLERPVAAQDPAEDREAIALRLVETLAESSRRVLLFQIQKSEVRPWIQCGADIDEERFRDLSIGLGEPSVFFSLRSGARFYRGPLSPMPSHRRLAACWGGELIGECLVLPIRIQRRLVAAVLVDPGTERISEATIGELERGAAEASRALEDFILRAKRAAQPVTN